MTTVRLRLLILALAPLVLLMPLLLLLGMTRWTGDYDKVLAEDFQKYPSPSREGSAPTSESHLD